jgi:hypothetical protein
MADTANTRSTNLRGPILSGMFVPTPEEIYAMLRGSGYSEDDILDLVKRTADKTGGWTPWLNHVGLMACKPGAPRGQEREA